MSDIIKYEKEPIKFYKTAEFRNLPIKKRKEILENYAKDRRVEVVESFEHNKKQVWNIGKWTAGLVGTYFAYQLLFSGSKKSKSKKEKEEKIINHKEKKIQTRIWNKIQNQIIDFAVDWLLDSAQEKFKKYTQKNNDDSQ